RQVKRECIQGTISLIERIGRTLRCARDQHVDPVEAVRAVTGGFLIWQGKIVDVARRTVGGFARGEGTVTGLGDWAGRRLTIGFQNEFLIARAGDEVLVTTPDLITVLDAETGEPITTETLRYGYRVVVLAIPGNALFRSAPGLDVVGPRYFGYDVPFVPVEHRFDRVSAATGEGMSA